MAIELVAANGTRFPRASRHQIRLRDECVNEHVFLSAAEARETIEAWRYSPAPLETPCTKTG
ncbi:MAG: hypothetical protein WA005_18670 [Candidatus Binataceae bacterium]